MAVENGEPGDFLGDVWHSDDGGVGVLHLDTPALHRTEAVPGRGKGKNKLILRPALHRIEAVSET